MAEFVTQIRTAEGDKYIDYEYLANKPVEDKETFNTLMNSKQDASTAITKNNIISELSNKTVANADNANMLGGKAASQYALAADCLKINGDTRNLVLTSGVHYGDELPAHGTKGRIFLKKV